MIRRIYRQLVPAAVRSSLQGPQLTLTRWWRQQVARVLVMVGRPVRRVDLQSFSINVDLRDLGVGRPIFCKRKYEEVESRFFQKHLTAGMTVLDIGANIGYFSILASQLTSPSGRVVSFEPDPYNYSLLSGNVSENKAHNVTLHPLALGERAGVATLFKSDNNLGDHRVLPTGSSSRERVEVQVRSLDELVEEGIVPVPEFIKMDVQGYEGLVVRGMDTLLKNPKLRVILTEYWPDGMAQAGAGHDELYSRIVSRGFKAYALTATGELTPATVAELVALSRSRDVHTPDQAYVNVAFLR